MTLDISELIAALQNAEQQCLEEYEHRQNSFVWGKTAQPWKDKAAGIRYAIDTAVALLTANLPAPDDPRQATCGRCGHFWDWHGQRDDGACKGGYPVGMGVTSCQCREERRPA